MTMNPYAGLKHDVVYGGDVNVWKKTAAARFTVGLGSQADFIGCSGSLVAPDVLLTAAHCVTDVDPNGGSVTRDPKIMTAYFVETASARQDPRKMKVQKIAVAAIEVNPKWIEFQSKDFTMGLFMQISIEMPGLPFDLQVKEFLKRGGVAFDHDLALVKLAKPAPRGYLIAELPDDDGAAPGCGHVISGFGRDEAGYAREPIGMRAGMSARVKPEGFDGGERFSFKGEANPENPGMCKGDSGGPLLEICDGRVRVLGVASRFTGDEVNCGKPGTEFMYAKTYNARDWLRRALDLVKNTPTGK